MEWQDQGLLLSIKRLGESKVLATFLTRDHGKQAGLISSLLSPHELTPLAYRLQLHWRGRTSEQLGHIKMEPLEVFPASATPYQDHLLKASLLSLLQYFLLSHDPHPLLYRLTYDFLKQTSGLEPYLSWEEGFLKDLGFGENTQRNESDTQKEERLYLGIETMAAQLGKSIPKARAELMQRFL